MKNVVFASDLQNTIEYLLNIAVKGSTSGKNELIRVQRKTELIRVQRKTDRNSPYYESKVTLNFNNNEATKEVFSYYLSVIKMISLDDIVTFTGVITEFLIWLGMNFVKDGKLKISWISYPKVIAKIIGMVIDIVKVVKKKTETNVLPTEQ